MMALLHPENGPTKTSVMKRIPKGIKYAVIIIPALEAVTPISSFT
jgi:hypothetical protein